MDYQAILNAIKKELSQVDATGNVANYIPELAKISGKKFGVHLVDMEGRNFSVGDSEENFSIQSISKVFALEMAQKIVGPRIWERVDVEPSGDPFNALTQLEKENGIPRNPFINSGALVVSDVLVSHLSNPKKELLHFVRQIAEDPSIDYDKNIVSSEIKSGYRNVALVNYMKSFGNIKNDVDKVLDFYFHQCALSMSCHQLAHAFIVFANQGKMLNGKQILKAERVKRINALMQTCGFYDEAGEFSFRVGLPGKSGVGGGIAAVHPHHYSVAVWSPLLNENGNSELGMKALESLTTMSGLSIF